MTTSTLDHIALLTRDIERTCGVLGVAADGIESFPSEGTRELYVGAAGGPRLLLMQAIGAGPYQRALEKRGPGLHHAALCVSSPRAFAAGSGWLVHPRQLDRPDELLWLAHPAVPCLIEVVSAAAAAAAAAVAGSALALVLPGRAGLVAGLGCAGVRHGSQAQVVVAGKVYAIDQLV